MLKPTQWVGAFFSLGILVDGCGARSGDDWPLQGAALLGGNSALGTGGSDSDDAPICAEPSCLSCPSCEALCECSGGDESYCDNACSQSCNYPDCSGCGTCYLECLCHGESSQACIRECEVVSPEEGGTGGIASGGSTGGWHAGGGTGGRGLTSGGGAGGTIGSGIGGFFGVGGLPNLEGCCTVHNTPLCSDLAVAACVCMVDMRCCTTAWDRVCVDYVTLADCGSCSSSGGTGGVSGTGGFGATGGSGGTGGFGAMGGLGASGGGLPSGGTPSTEPCCTEHLTPGCNDPAIAECVCGEDEYCCTSRWDIDCVRGVDSRGCGTCSSVGGSGGGGGSSGGTGGTPATGGSGGSSGTGGLPTGGTSSGGTGGGSGSSGTGGSAGAANGDCCAVHAGPGCNDPELQACVCDWDPDCCLGTWDERCVYEATESETFCGGCPSTGGAGGTGAGGAGGGAGTAGQGGELHAGACCETHGTPYCEDESISACVCDHPDPTLADPYCCDIMWDRDCVDRVVELGCGSCGSELDRCLAVDLTDNTACEACLCTSCVDSMLICDSTEGCRELIDCFNVSGCTSIGACEQACTQLIEDHGGILGAPVQAAVTLLQCAFGPAACPCP